uniref:Vacuolar protein sorting-associated protein 41 homolog n=1 Tax=Ciona intestinalis TaxID=7719 RepID=Q1RPV5_CIOIN|nr:zinc finger protein [Ciona intestinalis]BAE93330.1 zinc finger protein [Ciona intestinalis]|eukprot:NP_001071945.1 zinc finger protein [Ciona intestinalis]
MASDSESSEEEWEEPKLKYDRMGNDLLEILRTDAASCIALHSKFVALGTHWGIVYILDHSGNNNTSKHCKPHATSVTGISLDGSGEHVASCSDDGTVKITGLYLDENNQVITEDQPVKSVALDPNYSHSSSKQIVYGTNELVLLEKTWLGRNKRTVLHGGEGLVRCVKWRGSYIAWANDLGVKIYDMKQRRRITYIPRVGAGGTNRVLPKLGGTRVELYPAHIAWKDDTTLLIGWDKDIKVCAIRDKPSRDSRAPTKYCVVVHLFKTDFSCCGIAPLGDQIAALAYMEEDNEAGSTRPQLRILEPNAADKESFTELSRDALSIRGYQTYRCKDYSLQHDSTEIYFVSPKDIVVAQPRDEDDRVDWLLHINHHREALEAVKEFGKRLKKHTYMEVGLLYLDHLIDSHDFTEAASVAPQILGNNMNHWEGLVHRCIKAHQVSVITAVLPRGDFRLPQACYELVLEELLKTNHKEFEKLLNDWPNDLYNIVTITNKVLTYLDRDSHNPVLLAALAKLYAADQRFDRALSIYLRIQHPDTFKLIRKHNLYAALQDNVVALMRFGEGEAVVLLLDHMEHVPIDKVVADLKRKPDYLHKYLHALYQRDSHLGSEYHDLQLQLYAQFDRPKLLPFLKSSNYYKLETSLEICKERGYVDEQVFLLSRMGNASGALALITQNEENVGRAVEFCKEQNDSELWLELINRSIHKPEYIRGLLENIGTHVDPIILIRRIPSSMEIPGLRDAIVKILQDYSMQTALWFECRKVLSSDVISLLRKQLRVNSRPISIDEERSCDACGRPLLCQNNGSVADMPVIVTFLCHHCFHDDCLPSQNRSSCNVCRGNIRHS